MSHSEARKSWLWNAGRRNSEINLEDLDHINGPRGGSSHRASGGAAQDATPYGAPRRTDSLASRLSRTSTNPERTSSLRRTETRIKLRRIERGGRRIFFNVPLPSGYLDKNGEPKPRYPSNKIKTSKYSVLSFIPKNLFEQFRRVANLYFLFMAVLQLIPYFEIGSPVLTLLPIATVVFITACKDAFEDFKRHQVDNKFNGAITHTLVNYLNVNYSSSASSSRRGFFSRPKPTPAFDPTADLSVPPDEPSNVVAGPPVFAAQKWKNVHVGDFILLRNGDPVPADCVILSTSSDDNVAYVETKDLDGETNLKPRHAIHETAHVQSAHDCLGLHFYIESEQPTPNLYSYNGTLVLLEKATPSPLPSPTSEAFPAFFVPTDADNMTGAVGATSAFQRTHWKDKDTASINVENVLLRGQVMRNTKWVIASVIFTGTDTKIMLNSGDTPSKRSVMEKEMNQEIIVNFIVLFVLCTACAIGSGIMLDQWRETAAADLFDNGSNSSVVEAILTFWASLINFQNIIPISLYISIEFVKSMQAYFIYCDLDMWDEDTQKTCIPKSWNLSDDLGQIEYIFSDKTGTLTRNIMEFRKCSIRGRIYGDNGFAPESEGARGARLRREEEQLAGKRVGGDTGVVGTRQVGEGRADQAAYERRKMQVFEEYERELKRVFEPKYSSLDEARLTFADSQVFKDLQEASSSEQNTERDTGDGGIESAEGPAGQGNYVREFFTLLAICHTVVVSKVSPTGEEIVEEEHADDDDAHSQRSHDDAREERLGDNQELYLDPMDSRLSSGLQPDSRLNSGLQPDSRLSSTIQPDSRLSSGLQPDSMSKSGTAKKQRKAKQLHIPKLRLKRKRGQSLASITSKLTPPDPTVQIPLNYKAESPDESALVSAARNVGFTFVSRHGPRFVIDVLGTQHEFETLQVIEFNSTRKRMSVIVRRPAPWNDIVLFCKGADNVILERLRPEQDTLVEKTSQDIASFSNEGLRTLTLACRVVPQQEYDQWLERFKTASTSLENRADKVDAVYEEIERDLMLLGATAIEDKLQEGVPQAIELLRKAGIKVWVLTGDKLETAINIGFASNLLDRQMNIWTVRGGESKDEALAEFEKVVEGILDTQHGRPPPLPEYPVDNGDMSEEEPPVTGQESLAEKQQRKAAKELRQQRSSLLQGPSGNASDGPIQSALVIDGNALKHLLDSPDARERLLRVSLVCKSVICCRTSPLQKALVVELVRRGHGAVCLAIGDGANDVSMIQAANVGVGIAGQEGVQASMAADYAIGQFRFLAKLLLVHGHWSYQRVAEMTLNFFYKNVIWVFPSLWYQFFCAFSGNIFYDYTYLELFNLILTLMPVCVIGATDQIVTAPYALRYPIIYTVGIEKRIYTKARFWKYFADGIWQSLVCYFVFHFMFVYADPDATGLNSDLEEFSSAVAITVVAVANLIPGFNTHYWSWWQFGAVGFEIILVMAGSYFYSLYSGATTYGIADVVFGDAYFWLGFCVSIILCFLPRYTLSFERRWWRPNIEDVVRQIEKRDRDERKSGERSRLRKIHGGGLFWRLRAGWTERGKGRRPSEFGRRTMDTDVEYLNGDDFRESNSVDYHGHARMPSRPPGLADVKEEHGRRSDLELVSLA